MSDDHPKIAILDDGPLHGQSGKVDSFAPTLIAIVAAGRPLYLQPMHPPGTPAEDEDPFAGRRQGDRPDGPSMTQMHAYDLSVISGNVAIYAFTGYSAHRLAEAN